MKSWVVDKQYEDAHLCCEILMGIFFHALKIKYLIMYCDAFQKEINALLKLEQKIFLIVSVRHLTIWS